MRAEAYLPKAIARATGLAEPTMDDARDGQIHAVRLPPGVGVPSVIWRSMPGQEPDGPFQYVGTLDGSASFQRFFEIECRAKSCPGALAIADDIVAELSSVGAGVFSRYDEADDPSQKLAQPGQVDGDAGYFSHVIEIGLPDEGLPDINP